MRRMKRQKRLVAFLMAALLLCLITPALAADPSASPEPDVGLQVEQEGNRIRISPGNMVSVGGDDYKEGFDNAIFSLKHLAQFLTGVCLIFCIVFFCRSIVKLNVAGATGYVWDDKGAVMGLLFSGIGIMLFGGLEAVVSFAWDFLTEL